MGKLCLHCCNVYDTIRLVYHICYKKGVNGTARLAEVRQAHGMTQEQLAAVSGVHRVTIARIETGASSPNVDTLKQLADALGVLVDDLIDKEAG